MTYVGKRGVLIFDTLEGVYDSLIQDVAAVTDKSIVAAVYSHYYADHIGDIQECIDAAKEKGIDFEIIKRAMA